MKSLAEATKKLCELKGTTLAIECLLNAIAISLPEAQLEPVRHELRKQNEACRTTLLGAFVSEHMREQFERDAQRMSTNLDRGPA